MQSTGNPLSHLLLLKFTLLQLCIKFLNLNRKFYPEGSVWIEARLKLKLESFLGKMYFTEDSSSRSANNGTVQASYKSYRCLVINTCAIWFRSMPRMAGQPVANLLWHLFQISFSIFPFLSIQCAFWILSSLRITKQLIHGHPSSKTIDPSGLSSPCLTWVSSCRYS